MELSEDVVKHWLESSATEESLNADGIERTLDNLIHRGFLAELFEACAENIAALRKKSCMGTATQRSYRNRIRGVEHTFSLLRDAFEGGKIESCLSLDSDLHHKVTTLLYDIGKILSKGNRAHPAEGQRPGQDELHCESSTSLLDSALELERHLITAKEILELNGSDSESSSSDTSSDDTSGNASESVSPRLFYGLSRTDVKSLSTYVELLMSLCPILEQVYCDQHQARSRTSHHPPPIHVTEQALPYIQLIKDKFPLADPSLAERLGEANWQRHERLRQVDLPTQSNDSNRTSYFQPMSVFQDSALGSSIGPRSEKASSVASHSSFASSIQDSDRSGFRVPKIPANAEYGEPFWCPFCNKTLHAINNRVAWKLHVFADLQAYVCVELDCPDRLKLFPSRAIWFKHMSMQHLSLCQFHCKMCPTVLDNEDSFVHHLSGSHSIEVDTAQSRSAVLASARKVHLKDPEELQCPLCRRHNFCTTHREFATHVGKELEEVALSALPPQEDSGDEGEEVSDSDDEDPVSEPIEVTSDRPQVTSDRPQVTSYWSVPEQTKFPFLVQYYGRDFDGIAGFLKTKSATMIKNYYMRELSNGKHELERYADIADGKRTRGEPMGRPPSPVRHRTYRDEHHTTSVPPRRLTARVKHIR